ncbi:uncharacterized protein LOC133737191 [Rosa rugosa]|uniref:uncharacterized protein LOC133737191 n=1 Tax=Rosa rugosa TaxID=74645 RepID=UPI002B402E0F|nr:uncharacterized protein LOC133737191 [Rosa rugosa]
MRSRLDRAVATATWSDIFVAARVLHLAPIHGDHIPIVLGVFQVPLHRVVRQSYRFRFESCWTTRPECLEMVQEGWDRPIPGGFPIFQVCKRITHTRFTLNDWQRRVFGARRREIGMLREQLQILLDQPLTESNQQENVQLNSKLDALLEEENSYWRQRSKVTWLAEGDRNTKYFHRKASNRRAKNRLQGLFDHNGSWQESTEGIESVVLHYFSKMFTAGVVDYGHMKSVIELLQPRVTASMNAELCAPYTAVEIKDALFQMYPTKAPGPDGMPPLFFQKYWDVVGSDVVVAVQNFLHSGQILGEVNFTHICLIPKVKDPQSVSDLRPIALCNFVYKICSKAIANRLKKFLSQIISPFQSAFIPGRLITDNILVANEVSHFIHNCYSSSDGVFSLKLDMSKAYDRMEWCFLESVLLRLGFDVSWVALIMQCVTTVRYAFLLNGQPRGYLTPTRGLRQGDPLSPYLFLLCAEVFSALLERKVLNGELKGISVCEDAPVIHHLLFADDSLLFGKATYAECFHIKEVLKDYELASGQQINFSKSNIVFSKRVPEVDKQAMAGYLGVSIEAKHEKYLGLPTYMGRNKTAPFSYIKERLSKKLAGWQGKVLSSSGKDLLIRVVAQALPSYAMSCFLLPKEFCDSLHQMCARFWWGSKDDNRKIHWLSWERLSRPKEEGGMGFRDLYAHNLALLAKQGWRILRNPNSLVGRLFKARYFSNDDLLSAPVARCPSACWHGIYTARSTLQNGVRWQVGDGSRIRIWEYAWLPRSVLFRPIRYGTSSLVLVSELLRNGQWDKEVIAANFDAVDASLISSIPLSSNHVPDRLVWHFDLKGKFTTKSAYKLAVGALHPNTTTSSSSEVSVPIWKSIWAAKIPGKIKVHVWRACTSILPTISQPRDRRVFLQDGCYFCNDVEESIVHISRVCAFVKNLLNLFPSMQSVLATPMSSMLDWLSFCLSRLSNEDFDLLLMLIWGVWKERNQRVRSGIFHSVAQVHFQVMSLFNTFKAVNVENKLTLGRQVKPWCPPPVGWLKANVDGAYNMHLRHGGLGVVVRDSMGDIVAGACCRCDDVTSPYMVEALAGRLACKIALQFHLTPIIVESDCLRLVQAVQAAGEDTSEIGRIVDDISLALTSMAGSFFCHVYRESNKIAHKLASSALVSGLQVSWSGIVPPALDEILCNN